MKCIIVASPDKISIKRFIQFLRKYFSDFMIGEMHSLMSMESINLYLEDFFNKYSTGIISYYAKRAVNINPITILPIKIQEVADYLIWFDLYAIEPKILKRSGDHLKGVLMDWKRLIDKISH